MLKKNLNYQAPEVCRIRSTGVDSGRSQRFSTGAGAGPEVDIFDWTGAGAGVILTPSSLGF